MTKLRFLIISIVTILLTGCSGIYHADLNMDYPDSIGIIYRNDTDNNPVSYTDNASDYSIPDDFALDSYEDYDDGTAFCDDDFEDEASLSDKFIKEFSSLAPTTLMSFEELVGDNGIYDYPKGFRTPDTYKIIVDKYYQLVLVYTKDSDGEYTVPVRYMLCTTGATSSPTPSGTYSMKNYRVRYALFNNTDVYGQYWSLITGRIYFHSILYSDKDAATYTESSYSNLGRHVSHGCVRLTVPDARWIYYNAAPGTIVVIRDGSKNDIETAGIREQLILAKLPKERPESITGDIPYTDNWNVEDIPMEVEFIQGYQ